MKVILELTKNDMFKMLALSEATEEQTEKIMEKFSQSEEINIKRETMTNIDEKYPLAISSLVIIEIAKELGIKL